MRRFPGQITSLGLQGTQASIWSLAAQPLVSLAAFPLKSFQQAVIRSVGFFKGLMQ